MLIKTRKKNPDNYVELQKKYVPYTNRNELMTIPEALEAVATLTIYLLTTDLTTRQLIDVSRDTMEEALKGLQIQATVHARHPNAMWDALMASEQEAKKSVGSVLITKDVCLVTEYLATQKTRVTYTECP